MSTQYITFYGAKDIEEETLEPHPALRVFVRQVEGEGYQPTPNEALLINVIVRQQHALTAMARGFVDLRRTRETGER